MIERNKKIILFISFSILLTNIIGIILSIALDNVDFIGVCNIILVLLILLTLNILTGSNQKETLKNKKIIDETKELKRILIIFLIIQIAIALISSIILFG